MKKYPWLVKRLPKISAKMMRKRPPVRGKNKKIPLPIKKVVESKALPYHTFKQRSMINTLFIGNNQTALYHPELQLGSIQLGYIDPPFNTGKKQKLVSLKNAHSDNQEVVSRMSYNDSFDNFAEEFLRPRIERIHKLLTPNGSLFVHLDWREVHYVKVMMDKVFGRACFMNEIVWAYDYGARQKNKWPTKHDSILWYVKNPKDYIFNADQIDRIPYMAPGLCGPEKAARGKTPTDCWGVYDGDGYAPGNSADFWWNTIVPPQSKERTGYPTQKPIAILRRIVRVHSNPGDIVMDCFGGSGTTAVAAAELGRKFITMDQNPEAISVMKKRFEVAKIASYNIIDCSGAGEAKVTTVNYLP